MSECNRPPGLEAAAEAEAGRNNKAKHNLKVELLGGKEETLVAAADSAAAAAAGPEAGRGLRDPWRGGSRSASDRLALQRRRPGRLWTGVRGHATRLSFPHRSRRPLRLRAPPNCRIYTPQI